MRFQTCHSAGISVSELPLALLRSSVRLALKRAVDFLAGLVFIGLCSPLVLAIAFLVRIQLRGPIVEPVDCVGLHGKPFRMWRFRTTRKRPQPGELGLEAVISPRSSESWIVLGRAFRVSSLDRLPLLLNLVKGQMSLIGPRPILTTGGHELQHWDQLQRLSMRPGITGFWELPGFTSEAGAEEASIDLSYVSAWSFKVDLLILLKTALPTMTARMLIPCARPVN